MYMFVVCILYIASVLDQLNIKLSNATNRSQVAIDSGHILNFIFDPECYCQNRGIDVVRWRCSTLHVNEGHLIQSNCKLLIEYI